MPLPDDFAGTREISQRSRRVFSHLQAHPEKYGLLAVTLNDEPTNAIVRIEQTETGDYNVFPVYVEITPKMVEELRGPEGETPKSKEQG